jgi:hypothetical protein
MTNTFRKLLAALPIIFALVAPLALSTLAIPAVALADSKQINSNVWNVTILQGPLVTCVGATTQTGNPSNLPVCSNLCDLIGTVANVVYWGIGVVIWIILPIMFLWSGILFMISAGSQEKVGKARKMLTAAVIGALIVLCAYLLVYTFVNILQIQNYVGGFGTGVCTPPTS